MIFSRRGLELAGLSLWSKRAKDVTVGREGWHYYKVELADALSASKQVLVDVAVILAAFSECWNTGN
jgi:hypothetical protein